MKYKFRVIGAGVWGLAFSDYLLNLGHNVEIFRRDRNLDAKSIQQIGLKNITSDHIKSLDTLDDLKVENQMTMMNY